MQPSNEAKTEEKQGQSCDSKPCFKIANLGKSKGDGLIATRNIKAGELIFKENAILIDDCEQGYKKAFKLMKEKYDEWLKILPYYKSVIGDNATEYEIFKSQVDRCSFRRVDSEIRRTYQGKKIRVLYLQMSKINHSCLANASKSVILTNNDNDCNNDNNNDNNDNNNNDIIDKIASGIHALRDISKGEEITIFYDPKLIFLPTNQRRVELLASYAFDCQCVRCIYTDNDRKVKIPTKNSKNNNNKNKRLYEIKKAILFEKLLKAAKYPNHLTNNKSAKEKYVETMNKQFNQVDTLFITIQTLFRIVSNYKVKETIETCGLLVDGTTQFISNYEHAFLWPTHWRIIRMKRLADFSLRFYGGLCQRHDYMGKEKKLNESIYGGRLSILLSLMKSQHTLLIKNLKYNYFDQLLCVNISYFDDWLKEWELHHYNKKAIENDKRKKYCVEYGIDLLTQAKQKLLYLANTNGTAVKCFIDSTKALTIDKNMIKKHFEFACYDDKDKIIRKQEYQCAGICCWFSVAMQNNIKKDEINETKESSETSNGSNNSNNSNHTNDVTDEKKEVTLESDAKGKQTGLVASRNIAAGEIIFKHDCKDKNFVKHFKNIKHSCLPNASKSANFGQFWGMNHHKIDKIDNESTTASDIYALRDISKGEEITITYDWRLLYLPTNERLKQIKDRFGFDCKCIRCQLMLDENINTNTNDNNTNDKEKDKEKIISFEQKLQQCSLSIEIRNDSQLKQNGYISKMVKDFDDIEATFEEFVDVEASGEVYNARYVFRMFIFTSIMCDEFISKYESNYLASTHWRIIKAKQIQDMSIRNGLAIYAHWHNNDKQSIKDAFSLVVYELLLKNELDVIQTQYELFIKHFKYNCANDGLIIGANYVNVLMDRLFYIYYIDDMDKKQIMQFQSSKLMFKQLPEMAKQDVSKLIRFVNLQRVARLDRVEDVPISDDVTSDDQA